MRRRPDDPTALAGRLYDQYGASLYRYAVMLLADASAAEDAVQQVFASVLKVGIDRVQEDVHYLRRAVRNECYTLLRKRMLETTNQPFLEPRDQARGSSEERIALQDALRVLPPEQREVVHLHVYEGLTFQEIADESAESINTIASRYRYALAKLREHLK
jgi:RNA polymerase sigma-70 factor (ECF subfamily)